MIKGQRYLADLQDIFDLLLDNDMHQFISYDESISMGPNGAIVVESRRGYVEITKDNIIAYEASFDINGSSRGRRFATYEDDIVYEKVDIPRNLKNQVLKLKLYDKLAQLT